MKEPGSGRWGIFHGSPRDLPTTCTPSASSCASCIILPHTPKGHGAWGTKGVRNGTLLHRQAQRPTLWERPPGSRGRNLAVSLLPRAILSFTAPLAWAVLPRAGPGCLLCPTHKTWLMSSVLAKLLMGNWDTRGLISWWGGVVNTQATVRNSRHLELSLRLSGPPPLTGWVQGQAGPSFLSLSTPGPHVALLRGSPR